MKETEKFGLNAYILRQLGKERRYYGKIVIQKIAYFLQEAKNVDFGYRFVFYHYGPYSEELSRDIQLMQLNNLIISSIDPMGMGYDINLIEDEASQYIDKSKKIVEKYESKINKVLNDFAKLDPAQLELYATIHFVYNDLKKKQNGKRLRNMIFNIVKKMKPKFSPAKIENSYNKLLNMGYLK
jgi:uncharacterized protein YwgA